MKTIFIFFLFVICCSANNFAQTSDNDSTRYEIIKQDGTKYIGYILSDDGREVLVLTENLGKIYIPKSEIKTIRKIDSVRDFQNGKYLGEGVFTTRYHFTTNAFPIKRGEHYAALNLYGPEVHFSVADNLSVGVMTTWIASPFALAVKYTFESRIEKLNFGVGTLFGSTLFLNQAEGLGGLHWAMATYGDRRNNVTLSTGYGYFNFDFFSRNFFQAGTYAAGNVPKGKTLGFDRAHRGPIIGLGMTFALNENVSLLFDIMYLNMNRMEFYQEQFGVFDMNGELLEITYGAIKNTVRSSSHNLVFMPGMRFQNKPNRAFQVSLSGVIGASTTEYIDGFSGNQKFTDRYSFPLPNCTWFFNF
jgi:hypothetical protein